ncbi:hypothetical protein CK203_032536 [Vitis vinifera]|uniref:Uncharacterized protein n=1 Tax=Vitis vinifera TaxID=29760 RepID=A0A438I6P6_VITVI|nr:hypothetical protein CK203_032536 [Vitis vinifera]
MSKSVSELGLFNRQAPSASTSKSCGYHRGGSSSSYQTNSTNDSGSSDQSYEGYFAYLKSSYLTKIHLMGISKGHVVIPSLPTTTGILGELIGLSVHVDSLSGNLPSELGNLQNI